ncbi:hypothetical protein D3C87_2200530 [compost metagenome]
MTVSFQLPIFMFGSMAGIIDMPVPEETELRGETCVGTGSEGGRGSPRASRIAAISCC